MYEPKITLRRLVEVFRNEVFYWFWRNSKSRKKKVKIGSKNPKSKNRIFIFLDSRLLFCSH